MIRTDNWLRFPGDKGRKSEPEAFLREIPETERAWHLARMFKCELMHGKGLEL